MGGAADLFTQASNLKGMSDEDLVVTEGVHQANIEVNEEGSEAAAATAVVVGVRTIRRKEQFYADTPFLFIIYDFQNNVPLFAGKVVDPSNTIQIQDPPETTSQESEGDFDQTLGGTLVSGQPDLETCKRLLRDFPTAFDNHKICRKVKEAGEFLDWLRANRNLCETSEDHYTAFTASNCGSVWCQEAVTARSGWEADYQSQCEVTGQQPAGLQDPGEQTEGVQGPQLLTLIFYLTKTLLTTYIVLYCTIKIHLPHLYYIDRNKVFIL